MLTDDQWSVLEPLFQKERTGAGRPQIHSDREVLNGVLWVLRTGAAWADLPDRFPSSATCYRRFSKWVKDGRLRKILESLARHLEDNGLINLEECFIDGTFVVAKKGAQKLGKTKRGKGTKLMVIADASGLPIAVYTDSANPHEVRLVQATINEIVTLGRPRRIIGDRAYDSDPLDEALASQGIELIAPHRKNRKKLATQDGRLLRRYKRRWKIERLFAWLNKFKKAITRWERCVERFTALVHLAFSMILLRRVIKIAH
ncbi:IS5 family transposase [Desulfovibrio piger]|nr:IS5 family transposase [Desulfovibrio piger]MDM8330157.1 IS5 family transposase [Desulfovibrio piger]